MAETFLFLELLDPEINGLLYCIREIASGAPPRTNIHVTLRGPYSKVIPNTIIERTQRALRKDSVLIANPGLFDNPREHVVYLSVTHKYLQSVSWKRDFPVKEFGFNPHISLYSGTDGMRAQMLLQFLRAERIELICSDFKVSTYARRSPRLIEEDCQIQFFFPKLLRAGRIKADIFLRLNRKLNPGKPYG